MSKVGTQEDYEFVFDFHDKRLSNLFGIWNAVVVSDLLYRFIQFHAKYVEHFYGLPPAEKWQNGYRCFVPEICHPVNSVRLFQNNPINSYAQSDTYNQVEFTRHRWTVGGLPPIDLWIRQ